MFLTFTQHIGRPSIHQGNRQSRRSLNLRTKGTDLELPPPSPQQTERASSVTLACTLTARVSTDPRNRTAPTVVPAHLALICEVPAHLRLLRLELETDDEVEGAPHRQLLTGFGNRRHH